MAAVLTRPSSLQTGSDAPVKYDAAQLKLLSLVVEKPELKDIAATKLAAVTEELQHASLDGAKGESNDSPRGPLEHPNSSPTPQAKIHSNQRRASAEDTPIDKLKNGFLGFKTNYYQKEPQLFEPLKDGQTPKVLMIACCDSRVSPDTIFGAPPGEVFTVRNIANLIPPMEDAGGLHGTSAALEYAVLHLKVEHIVVKGHRACGGIKALMTMTEAPKTSDNGPKSFIPDWMNIAAPAKSKTLTECKDKDLETQLRFCEKESINNSLNNLLTFPWIKQAVDEGRLQLHGWYYDFVDGALSAWTLQGAHEEKLA